MKGKRVAEEKRPATVGELRASGHRVVPVRDEMRRNLLEKIKKGDTLFPSLVGYEDTVIPQVENAILSGQDIIFLGERGQAKSRLTRGLTGLLDEAVPAVDGCEINDNPFSPICRACRDRLAEHGDEVPVRWLSRAERYGEKLATPDISVPDLIGEVDPVRVAEGRYLGDELTIHYGLVPRSNRGIFAVNELPDLAERIQVSLFNLMEERDVQIKGYRVWLPLDVYVVATANPEDYTNRGRIVTPLKDRYGAQIRTHYPRTVEQEMDIAEAERAHFDDTRPGTLALPFMKEIIGELTSEARRSPEVNQRSGVSVRVTIANYECVLSNALRRAIRLGEDLAVPRISDLPAVAATTAGKIELDSVEEGREEKVLEDVIKRSVLSTFNRYFSARDFEGLLRRFEEGLVVELGSEVSASAYTDLLPELEGITEASSRLQASEHAAALAAAVEFVLEGLHLNRRLNRERANGKYRYRKG